MASVNQDEQVATQAVVKPRGPNSETVQGDIEYDGRVVLYIIKADETSYINYIKPLLLCLELRIPHVLSVIDTHTEWYYSIHPERYVPALKDRDLNIDSSSSSSSNPPSTTTSTTTPHGTTAATPHPADVIVFESTACLQYLAERYDTDGLWIGRTAREKGAVLSWMAYQTAGIGATAKYWLYFLRGYPSRASPELLPRTVEKLHANTLRQWDILNARLLLPSQDYIALADRPTLADLSYLPFAMPGMFALLGVEIGSWPGIEKWWGRMEGREAVREVMERGPRLGH